ncbi:FAD binding domain-containing protein [Lipomyces kononenkoae]|uniref:FAD binding domain-containing protein n=1 Tax=Lipomyces kononenkoae TaxID=34357 RepID=A0ACC3T076_LIPKO
MATTLNTSVVVVGGSLVGLSTALFLSHWNVPVIVLERHLGSSRHPRAVGYTARTIELLISVGTQSRLPELGKFSGPPRRITVESLAGKWGQDLIWTRTPQNAGGDKGPVHAPTFKEFSPTESLASAQDKIEPVLRERAAELGADLKLGFTVTSWQQDEEGVSVTAIGNDGQELRISAKYLIACDGGKSPIREELGIQRHGVGHLRGLRSILFRCPQLDEYFHRGYQQFQIEGREDGFEAMMTTYGEGRIALMWNETGNEYMDAATQKGWIRKAAGRDIPDDDITLITTGQWEIGGYINDAFSSGRVFLAGDAAHQLPPNRGGYGANTGIADAHNISWKIAAVLEGTSRPELLETYDAERRPVAQTRHDQIFLRDDYARYLKDRDWTPKNSEIFDDVAMEFGQLYRSGGIISVADGLPDAKSPTEWKGQPGTRAPHVRLRRGGEIISSLDLAGKTWVVVSEDQWWEEVTIKTAQDVGVDCNFVHIGGEVKEEELGKFGTSFGVTKTGAVLVRPDGYVAWRVETKPGDAASVFRQALARGSYSVKASMAYV